MKIQIYQEPDQCNAVWNALWPREHLFDLWEVRNCFHRAFKRSAHFHSILHRGRISGLLALSYDEAAGAYLQFPGETWHGRTWLERNRIIAGSRDGFDLLLDSVPGPMELRYLAPHPFLRMHMAVVEDEAGFVFWPVRFNYSFDNYWAGFSAKARKRIRSDMNRLEKHRIEYRLDRFSDMDEMFRLNQNSFFTESYFSDPRFYNAFMDLGAWLEKTGMLRITTILLDSKVAAVDMGAVFKNNYTLLAGGTDPEFPGVAKMMNLYHLQRACKERFDSVDFLCGDFNWKRRFRLDSELLYTLKTPGIVNENIRCA